MLGFLKDVLIELSIGLPIFFILHALGQHFDLHKKVRNWWNSSDKKLKKVLFIGLQLVLINLLLDLLISNKYVVDASAIAIMGFYISLIFGNQIES